MLSLKNKDKIILYIHGGGFVMGSATDRTGMLMANELGYKMYAIDYQLAPEAKFPVAMNECVEVYKYLISNYNPQNIVGVSTSAGCTHMLAMLLKVERFKPEHLGQLNFYLEALDRDVRKPHENPSIGILLCKGKYSEVVEYVLSRSLSPALVSDYQTQLPDKKLLQQKLHELFENHSIGE